MHQKEICKDYDGDNDYEGDKKTMVMIMMMKMRMKITTGDIILPMLTLGSDVYPITSILAAGIQIN